jgi:hypothetical protein
MVDALRSREIHIREVMTSFADSVADWHRRSFNCVNIVYRWVTKPIVTHEIHQNIVPTITLLYSNCYLVFVVWTAESLGN